MGRNAVLQRSQTSHCASFSRSSRSQRRASSAALRPCCKVREMEVEGCTVTAPYIGRPKGVVHFIGGAFAGAAPNLFYDVLIDKVASSGYTVISTPYAVSFQHDATARYCQTSFNSALRTMQTTRSLTSLLPSLDCPYHTHGLGHSNGALLHLMIGALCSPSTTSNIIISFNNREVGDAVPVPVAPLQAAVDAMRANNRLSTLVTSSAESTLGGVMGGLRALGAVDKGIEDSLTSLSRQLVPVVSQVGSVLDEVGDGGAMAFSPTPQETRQLIRQGYAVPATLLVKFRDDSIDETPELKQLLSLKPGLVVRELALPGNHLTPVGRQVQWEVRGPFSPIDALGQVAVQLALKDLDTLGNRVVTWLDAQ